MKSNHITRLFFVTEGGCMWYTSIRCNIEQGLNFDVSGSTGGADFADVSIIEHLFQGMWRFSKSNGITEGFHRKIKGIQRRGYGYRNFENYKLRVLVECSHGR